ncbi:serine/threonine protein kinase [Yinghuangia soli]|uniref:non-specific serine/threonine protein kinase n=1 Tax=Yinghuangia soli TaxID=2908204 RepID=A0AA41Q4R3_9ACTN|nr:serine/threonine protein kinase [Yinghuangia soli]MCF2530082.1 protein kinase [Yinghuangia soli]
MYEEAPGPGRRVCDGRFELRERLGSGAMGTVWRAVDTMLHREVALKEVRAPLDASAEEAAVMHARALREARALARLRNPHVVTVHQVVDEEPFPWIVMELVPGRTLAAVLAAGPLPPHTAAAIGADILDALANAHAAGVLHRDVKPANVLIQPDGRAVLVDFGIAAVEGASSVTATGSFIGTLEYLAPERAAGLQPTAATDLWSLGVLLYVAVEGRSPFRRANQWAVISAIVNEPHAPATQAGPLAGLIDALLAKDPAARPDAAAVARALDAAKQPGPAPGAAPGPAADPGPPGASAVANAPTTLNAAAGPPAPPIPPAAPDLSTVTSGPPPRPASAPRIPAPAPVVPVVPAPPGRRRTRNVVVAIAAAVLLVGGGVAGTLVLTSGGNGSEGRKTGAAEPPSASTTAPANSPAPGPGVTTGPPPATASTTPAGTPAPATTPPVSTPPAGPPTGYELRTHSAGFTVAVPKGWKETRDKSGNPAYESPDGSSRLVVRVLRGDTADPYAEQLRSANETRASASYPGYRQLALNQGTRDGGPSATWEYTYTAPEGSRHLKDIRWRVGTTSYNLWIAAPDGPAWPQYAEQLDIALAHFQDTRA